MAFHRSNPAVIAALSNPYPLLDQVLGQGQPTDAELGLADLSGWTFGHLHREGFDQVEAHTSTEQDGQQVVVVSYTHRGATHRIGGPARVLLREDGSGWAMWARAGCYHRADGPSRANLSCEGTWTPTNWNWERWGADENSRARAGYPSQRVERLLAAGARPDFVVPLLSLPAPTAKAAAARSASREEIETLVALHRAGAPQRELLAVAAGKLPASWASAGL